MTISPQTATTTSPPDASAFMPRLRARRVGPIMVAVALFFGLITFLLVTGLLPIAATHEVVLSVLVADGLLVCALIVLIVREILVLRRARRAGQAASRLHERVVRLFAIVASVPVAVIAIAASVTLDRGLESIFSGSVRQSVEASANLANAYLNEQVQVVRAEAAALVQDIERVRSLNSTEVNFGRFLTAQAMVRGLTVVRVLKTDGSIVDRADLPMQADFSVPAAILDEVSKTDDIIANVSSLNDRDFIEAILKLQRGGDEILYVVRQISPQIAQHLRATQAGLFEYQALQSRRLGLQIAFALMFALIAFLVTLSAVYLGLSFANRLVQPIRRLIGAADQVAAGDLDVEVHIRKSEGDLANLGDTFNKMTAELRDQRADLIAARDQIDSRRRFTEAVLAGVTAGVIGLDEAGRVTLLNRFAMEILGVSESELSGTMLAESVPEFAELIAGAARGAPIVQGQVMLVKGGRERTLVVRVALEADENGAHGAVVTLDDVTDLVVAQRTSAWADIARRIAHEIKNPLTPIQLSAERLKRRYGRVITEDREVFDQCTDTIIRQVGDIGRMVDEFSSFARMPKPVFEMEDVADTVRQAVFMMRIGYPEIDIVDDIPEGPLPASFDRRLISQALTNIIKNATEAIAAVAEQERGKGRILVRLTANKSSYAVDVVDNGIGLPKENRHRLLEPYVTTREKGTGLGLAIVGKILEEHGGGLGLYDAPAGSDEQQRGALIRLSFRDQRLAVQATAAAE
ncbi:sensor histidine kinase NtrY-like [Phreatobacter cathodiphilus]|uniref:histidine kinase n=1 Tax=Phreatobacter cathodiphilus TaxID=1868589 RepID=A0A2S0NAI3_9HYPH|nr:PAS domain-containing sensor histidine kinase [Phreatobacter cathodiphilus]AVO44941.1 PAS domain-containing sensor histidine kinase [Phreatobacter cathodiphilus]